jgi:hypothetical protein
MNGTMSSVKVGPPATDRLLHQDGSALGSKLRSLANCMTSVLPRRDRVSADAASHPLRLKLSTHDSGAYDAAPRTAKFSVVREPAVTLTTLGWEVVLFTEPKPNSSTNPDTHQVPGGSDS